MGQLLPLALLQARGEHIGLNAIMHSYLTPDLPKYSCLSFFSSVLNPRGAHSIAVCHKCAWMPHLPCYLTYTCILTLYFQPSAPCQIHLLPPVPYLSLPCSVSGGTGNIEATNLHCTSSGHCTFSTDTAGCTHSQDLVLQCSKLSMYVLKLTWCCLRDYTDGTTYMCAYILGQSSVVDLLTT